MENTDVPSGPLQPPSSTLRVDELLCDDEMKSPWKIISMPNLVTWCHGHKCAKCSMYLEHLLLGAHMGELCAHPDGLNEWLGHAWPTTMDNIRKAVAQPLEEDINVTHRFCNIKDDEINQLWLVNINLRKDLAVEHRAWLRAMAMLDHYKGKQREESKTAMGNP